MSIVFMSEFGPEVIFESYNCVCLCLCRLVWLMICLFAAGLRSMSCSMDVNAKVVQTESQASTLTNYSGEACVVGDSVCHKHFSSYLTLALCSECNESKGVRANKNGPSGSRVCDNCRKRNFEPAPYRGRTTSRYSW